MKGLGLLCFQIKEKDEMRKRKDYRVIIPIKNANEIFINNFVSKLKRHQSQWNC
jgi:hypothetical protein